MFPGAFPSVEAKEFVVSDLDPTLHSKWMEARLVFHEAWFERADGYFSQLRRESPDFALAFAYSAVIDSMLYRDVEANATRAEDLAESSAEGEARMATALVAFARGDLGKAEASLRRFLRRYPDDPYGGHALGFILIDQARPEEGVAELERVLEAHPSFYAAYNHLGYGLAAAGRHAEALRAFRSFVEAAPLNPSAHDSLADGLQKSGEREAAIAHLARSVLLDPRFAYGWKHLGDVYAEGGEKLLASRAYEQAIEAAAGYGPGFRESVAEKIARIR